MILTDITPEELYSAIRAIVREEIGAKLNRPFSRREISELWGVCMGTVDNIIKKEGWKSVTPASAHPKYSASDIMNYKPKTR